MILGVDPGGTTGLVAREHRELMWSYTALSGEGIIVVLEAARDSILATCDVVAIEEVTAPRGFANGRREFISPGSLIPTAMAAGMVAAWALVHSLPVLWVSPAHNGQGALSAYPEALRPSRGQGKGHDRLRHCRSAWDVAGTAAMMVAAR